LDANEHPERGTAVSRRSTLATAILGTLARVASAAPGVAAERQDAESLEASRLRIELGLDGRPSVVANLLGSSSDVGSADWGIPMTRDESEAVNLGARMAFADHVDMNVLARLRDLPAYAGAYYEPAANGRLTLLVTALDDTTSDNIRGWIGPTDQDWQVEVRNHSMNTLRDALANVPATWDRLGTGISPLGAGVDVRANGLFIEIKETEAAAAGPAAELLSASLDLPVAIRIGKPGVDTHCTTNRDHCHAPMKAGINIYKGANFSSGWCTMGFHIRRNFDGDKQFVTSGHCGYEGSNSWYHPAFASAIGSEQQTLYVNGGQDVMRVSMQDAEASDDVFNESNNIVGHGTPTVGETLCASLGKGSNTIKCGTVQDDWRSLISDTANPDITVWGGDMSYTTVGGDSGSPVYRRLPGGTGDDIRAIGVNAHQNGYFARISTALTSFDATVVQ
jgi:hypothetical protein